MPVHTTLTSLFTDIANAIRNKKGTSESIIADNFPSEIASITGTDTSDATATASDIRVGKTAYAKGNKITGTADIATAVYSDENLILTEGFPVVVGTGANVDVIPITINNNGTYTAEEGDAYSPVTVNVPASAVDSGTLNISTNGEHNVVGYANANVSIPTGTIRSGSDVTVSGKTITIPDGLYQSQVQKSVADGSVNSPTASKSGVSNYQITITPSVSYSTGYITGGSKNGTVVTVSASELVSGTLNINSNNTYDVTNYKYASVNVTSKNGQMSTAVGSINGTGTTYIASGVSLTCNKTGTYTVMWNMIRSNSSASGCRSCLYIGGSKYGSTDYSIGSGTDYTAAQAQYTSNNNGRVVVINNVSISSGQTLEVYHYPNNRSYYVTTGGLTIIEQ